MLPWRPTASDEQVKGYDVAAWLAERRWLRVQAWDAAEAKQWAKVITHCRMMQKARLMDAPDSKVAYEIPMDPNVLQERIAHEVMRESDMGWDIDGEVDPRRPMELGRRMALAAALRLLSPTERVVATMSIAWLLPKDLIAETLDIDVRTVENHLSRVRKKFAQIRREADFSLENP